jgi:uracil-DNA glycosylase
MTKAQQLKALYEEIIADKNKWTFPALEDVRGFLGTGPVMVVAARPSMARFDPRRVVAGRDAVSLLYKALQKDAVVGHNAHVTDYIKTRARGGAAWPEDLQAEARLFERELDIVQPRWLIALGEEVFLTLRHPAAVRGIALGARPVLHYAYARRFRKTAEFMRQMAKALARCAEGRIDEAQEPAPSDADVPGRPEVVGRLPAQRGVEVPADGLAAARSQADGGS